MILILLNESLRCLEFYFFVHGRRVDEVPLLLFQATYTYTSCALPALSLTSKQTDELNVCYMQVVLLMVTLVYVMRFNLLVHDFRHDDMLITLTVVWFQFNALNHMSLSFEIHVNL